MDTMLRATGDPDKLGPVDGNCAVMAAIIVSKVMEGCELEGEGAELVLPSHVEHAIAHLLQDFLARGGNLPADYWGEV